MRYCIVLLAGGALLGCASVHQEDLDAWAGAPVSALDEHPIFLTMQLVKTVTPDGVEIRNYVNGAQLGNCASFGSGSAVTNASATAFGHMASGNALTTTNYGAFQSCMQRHAACNNIFYIRNGVVQQFTPVGSGGMHCYTKPELRPGFRGAINIQ